MALQRKRLRRTGVSILDGNGSRKASLRCSLAVMTVRSRHGISRYSRSCRRGRARCATRISDHEKDALARAPADSACDFRWHSCQRHEEFARLIALEAGKPIKTARVETDRAIFTFAVAAEEATRIGGEWIPLDWQVATSGRAGILRRFPLGPILAITPFNFPLNLVAHKVAPAIAAGARWS